MDKEMNRSLLLLLFVFLSGGDTFARQPVQLPPQSTAAQKIVRARDLGVPFEGTPGPLNAITDVKGVEVGHTTLISGEGALKVGMGPVRNGVIAWRVKNGQPKHSEYWWSLPVVAETWDGWLNDVNGFHVHPEHVFAALDSARPGPVEEGNVGGGTGMICYEFKGGIGTASRKLPERKGGYTVGVLLQCNHGSRHELRIAGAPVGREIRDEPAYGRDNGSIIVVVATDAPLLPHQMKRIARRVTLGLGRNGSTAGNGSGDIFIAFSTANPGAFDAKKTTRPEMMANDQLDPLFEATVQAVEEAEVNALVAAKTMVGIANHRVIALPHDRLRAVLEKYNRLEK